MSKRQLIDEIRQYNLSVQPQFLAQFDDAALKQYLEHLKSAQNKHIRIGGWGRRPPKPRLGAAATEAAAGVVIIRSRRIQCLAAPLAGRCCDDTAPRKRGR